MARSGSLETSPRLAPSSPRFSPRGEAKCVRGASVRGARRLTTPLDQRGVLEQYVEHGEQAQRSNGEPIACFDRQAVRNAGLAQGLAAHLLGAKRVIRSRPPSQPTFGLALPLLPAVDFGPRRRGRKSTLTHGFSRG